MYGIEKTKIFLLLELTPMGPSECSPHRLDSTIFFFYLFCVFLFLKTPSLVINLFPVKSEG